MDQYNLNNQNLKDVYGVVVSNGTASLLAFAKRKDSLTVDFGDEDGIQIDLSDPKFGARQITLKCSLTANSRDDFKSKYYGLNTALQQMDSLELYSYDVDQTFFLYFIEQQNNSKLTKKVDSDKVIMTFDLVFGEVNPEDNLPKVYLVDDQDRYLTA